LKDKRVGVIGSGATSIQVVPSLQPITKSIQVYVRSPTYILPTVGFGVESSSYNEICRFSAATEPREAADGAGVDTADEQKKFSDDAAYYRKFRKGIEQQMNENFMGSIKNSKAQEQGRQVTIEQSSTHFR
jgi:hydroxyversicolorone monooxygenase